MIATRYNPLLPDKAPYPDNWGVEISRSVLLAAGIVAAVGLIVLAVVFSVELAVRHVAVREAREQCVRLDAQFAALRRRLEHRTGVPARITTKIAHCEQARSRVTAASGAAVCDRVAAYRKWINDLEHDIAALPPTPPRPAWSLRASTLRTIAALRAQSNHQSPVRPTPMSGSARVGQPETGAPMLPS